MRLYLMRHGIAIDREDSGCPPEAERYLTEEGMAKTRGAARGLATLGIDPGAWLTSPFVRALQTAQVVAEEFGVPKGKIACIDTLLPSGKPAEFFKEVSRLKAEEVICFGHAPQMDELIAFALGSRAAVTALKKAGVAALKLDRLSPPAGVLLWLHTPKTLRLLGE